MLEFLILWLITIVTAFGMQIANTIRLFKNVVDAGYKFDITKYNDIIKNINPDVSNLTLLKTLIPFANILFSFQEAIMLNENSFSLLSQFEVMGCLEKLSLIEKEKYDLNPTGFNAFLLHLDVDRDLSDNFSISFKEGNEEGIIYFNFDSNDDVYIVKTFGCASKLSMDDKIKKIEDLIIDMLTMLLYVSENKVEAKVSESNGKNTYSYSYNNESSRDFKINFSCSDDIKKVYRYVKKRHPNFIEEHSNKDD